MSRTTTLVAAWVAAATVSIVIATAAVASVRGRVSEPPQPLATATTLAASGTTTPASTTEPAPTSTSALETTTTGPSTTTTVPAPSSTTSTTTPAPLPQGDIRTYAITGGTVSIEVFPDHLVLLGAVPAAGFRVEERDLSPHKIEIEFKSGEHESKFVASLESGELRIKTEGDDGDD